MEKEPMGSLLEQRKEPAIERIFMLVERYPSRSAAARAWDINVNTLKNYYRRQDISPTPRPALLRKIAECEGVSFEWLMTGDGEPPHDLGKNKLPERTKEPVCAGRQVNQGLFGILSLLTEEEQQSLYQVLARKGVDTMIHVLMELAMLTPSELERVVRLAQQIREGASEGDPRDDRIDPTRITGRAS